MLKRPMQLKIEWLLSLPNVTPALLVRLVGLKGESAVSEWKRTGRVAKAHLRRFAEISGTTTDWWLDDSAPIPPTDEWTTGGTVGGVRLLERATQQEGDVQIPVLDVIGSMGAGRDQPEYDTIAGDFPVTRDWLARNLPKISSPSNLAIITAYGGSMEPTFKSGDILVVDRGATDVVIDTVYVLALRGELYIKRLTRHPISRNWIMSSDNKLIDPIEIRPSEMGLFQVLGRVVWAWNGKSL